MPFPLSRLWSPVEVRRTVPAEPATVWAVLADPDTYPRWLVGAQSMRAVDPGFPRPGSAFHHEVGPTEDLTVADRTEAVFASAPERLVLEVHAGPFRALVDFLVLPAPGGSEVRFRETPQGPWRAATPALRPVLHARNVRSLEQLADLLAGGDGTDVVRAAGAAGVAARP